MSKFKIQQFEEYKVLMYSEHTNANIYYAIELPLEDGRAILRFLHGDLPHNYTKELNGKTIYYVHFHKDQFDPILDVLRNEDNLFFYYNHENNESYMTTSEEHVGHD